LSIYASASARSDQSLASERSYHAQVEWITAIRAGVGLHVVGGISGHLRCQAICVD
jgi:hypothetical protein